MSPINIGGLLIVTVIAVLLGGVYLWQHFSIKKMEKRKGSKVAKETDAGFEEVLIRQYPQVYWIVLCVYGVLVAGMVVLYIIPRWNDVDHLFGVDISVAQLVAGILGLHIVLSIWILHPAEFGATTCLGLAVNTYNPGPHFMPFGIFQRRVFPSDLIELPLPASPNLLFDGDDKDPVPKGMERVWRFVTGAPEKASDPSETNQLQVQMVLSVSIFVAWRLRRTGAFNYIISASGDPDQVREQVSGIAQAVLGPACGKRTVAEIISDLNQIATEVRTKIEEVLGPWGVDIITCRVNSPNISHDLATAIRDAAKARAVAVKKITEAKGTTAETGAPEVGLAEGLKVAAELLGLSTEQVLAAFVARNTIGAASTIVAPGTDGLANMAVTLASVFVEALQKVQQNKGGQ